MKEPTGSHNEVSGLNVTSSQMNKNICSTQMGINAVVNCLLIQIGGR